jgi:hypothetical protein
METYKEYRARQLQEMPGQQMPAQQQAPQQAVTGALGRVTSLGARGQRAVARAGAQLAPGMYSAAKGAKILADNLLSIVQGDPKAEMKMKRITYLLYKAVQGGNLHAISAESPEDEQP